FAELGVFRGNSAAVLAHYARQRGRQVVLFDTFAGFDAKDLVGIDRNKGQGFVDTSLETVKSVVSDPSAIYVKGWFPASVTQEVEDRRYAVVHLDCDLYEPMIAGLKVF
ncbi:MAG TPA: TylF/MycF/NovP-related O-methyltransferase, partial [Rhodopila sp.]|nr:TylF/MycF/NovP-related O-methyltransferase [Rhodopila sp.]